MNEHEQHHPETSPDKPTSPRYSASLEALAITSDDPEIVARWEEGITRYGYAFIAFTRLGTPELHTLDALAAFERRYYSSKSSIEECIRIEIEALGWTPHLRRLREELGIPVNVLHWDYDAMEVHIRQVFDIVEEGGKVHLFAK